MGVSGASRCTKSSRKPGSSPEKLRQAPLYAIYGTDEISEAGRSERERIDITAIQKRIDRYFTHASLDDLRGMFDIAAEPDHAILHADRVDMKPTRKQVKQGLERLELWIDRESEMLVQMRLTFPGGDQTTIALEDIATNEPVSDDAFRIRP